VDTVEWSDVSDFVAASNVVGIGFDQDIAAVNIDAYYFAIDPHRSREASIRIVCSNVRYFDLRRMSGCDPGPGHILEAHLRENSDLLEAFRQGGLAGRAGDIQSFSASLVHFELVGEISLNIICEHVDFTWSGIKSSGRDTKNEG
jgi:hypothetical protein